MNVFCSSSNDLAVILRLLLLLGGRAAVGMKMNCCALMAYDVLSRESRQSLLSIMNLLSISDQIHEIAVISAVTVSAAAEMEPAKPEMWRLSTWSQ